jgi:zinc protease
MLKLMTGAIASPRFDPSVAQRLRTATLANYASIYSQPVGVLQAFGGSALHGGDDRFQALPARETIDRLTAADFQRFWTARLNEGPVRVTIVGDVDPAVASAAVARTLGTLTTRPVGKVISADLQATRPAAPVVLRHQGDPGQALIVRVFPTLGAFEEPSATAALDVAAGIIQSRLTEGFRETDGGTYTPLATHAQSPDLPRYGVLLAGAQVQTARVDAFGRVLDSMLANLAAQPANLDEFARAQTTAVSLVQRNRESNEWWLGVLSSELTDARAAEIAGRAERLKAQTPASVQAAVARYLAVRQGFTIEVRARPAATTQ